MKHKKYNRCFKIARRQLPPCELCYLNEKWNHLFCSHLSLFRVPFLGGSLGIIMNDNVNETKKKLCSALYQQAGRVCACALPAKPGKARKLPRLRFLSSDRQRGEINVRNNKILRTSDTRGDSASSAFRSAPFEFFPFAVALFIAFWSHRLLSDVRVLHSKPVEQ